MLGRTKEIRLTWRARLSRFLCPDCGAYIKSYIGYRNSKRWTSGLFCPNCDWGDKPMGECIGGDKKDSPRPVTMIM